MKKITGGRLYSKEDFVEEQKLWSKNDPYKQYEPSQDFVTITYDGEVIEGVYENDRESLLDHLHNIVMADSAGSHEQGGIDLTESERRGYFHRFRYTIEKARDIANYFEQYIEEDKKSQCFSIDEIV